ncbi:MAG: cation:dicarboxylase symporter family transporter [Bacteroidales bacterium]|nr:cation:dicarboxylase symporter family transporter [Bacteroidales bacterium]
MKSNFLKNYGATLLLLLGLLVGGTFGAVLGEKAQVLRAPGMLFLNLVFVLVVPLVFFSVAHSMVTMRQSGVIGKVLGASLGVFLLMSLVAGVFSYGLMAAWNPFDGITASADASEGIISGDGIDFGDALVSALTVSDFPLLLSREHLLPLIIFAALLGLAVALLEQKAALVERFISEGESVIMKMMELVMKLAPIGIGCYFADTIGTLGGRIVGEYLEIFLAVCAACAVCYLVFNSLYALIARVPLGKFWKEMLAPSATAVGTCSSAACIPVNMTAARNLGVSDKIADGVIPLGTNLHKDGSVITSVAKVLFALCFFGTAPQGPGTAALVILLAIVESVVVGAIPVGGMTGEILICAVLGLDPSFAAALLIIGTICDIPATLLNATGNIVAPLLVQRFAGAGKGR